MPDGATAASHPEQSAMPGFALVDALSFASPTNNIRRDLRMDDMPALPTGATER
jgi:hypothetical protein